MKKSISTFLIISIFLNGFFIYYIYNENERINKLEENLMFSISRSLYNAFDDFNYDLIEEDKYLKKDKEYVTECLNRMESKTRKIADYYFFNQEDPVINDKKWVKNLLYINGYFDILRDIYSNDKALDKQGRNTLKEILHKGGIIGNILESAENYDKKLCDITPLESLKTSVSEIGDLCKVEQDRLSKLKGTKE